MWNWVTEVNVKSGVFPGEHIVENFLGYELFFKEGSEDVFGEPSGDLSGVEVEWPEGAVGAKSPGQEDTPWR